jgi:hypothetical protein
MRLIHLRVAVEGSTAGRYRAVGFIFHAEYFTALKIPFLCRRARFVVANHMKAVMDAQRSTGMVSEDGDGLDV